MPAFAFDWNYTPFQSPFTPILDTTVSRFVTSDMATGRGALFDRWSYQEATVEMPTAVAPMFRGDFYNRFHVSALVFTLGNLVGNQVRELRVWNAFRRARVLEDLELIDGEGITVGGQPNPPLQFAPLQERVYTLEISTDGPPSVDAKLVFDLDEGESITIAITGSRVTPWVWRPDWSQEMAESLEWRTEIIESENDSEQAISMRLAPRRSIGFGVGAELQERQAMETATAGWGGRVWSVPLWFDGVDLTSALPIGSTLVSVPTEGRDFYEGGLAMFMGQGWRDYEVVEVATVYAGQVELRRPTVRAWPSGSVLYPARTARMDPAGTTFGRFTGRMSSGRVNFDLVGPCDWPELTGLPTYRGLPVLEDIPEWSSEPTLLLARKLGILDNGISKPDVIDRADVPLLRQAHKWSAVGRAQLARLRSLAYLLKGRWGAIWVPSWVEDFTLAAQAPQTGSALDVNWQGYTLYLNGARNRRDVRIANAQGVQYARIASSTELDASTERLGLDTPLVRTYEPADTVVSYLTLWRLDTDRLEWSWWSGDMGGDYASADVSMPMRTFRHDL